MLCLDEIDKERMTCPEKECETSMLAIFKK